MKFQADEIMKHSRPDLVVLKKESRHRKIIDVSCPFDTRVVEKEKEKVNEYQDLKWELNRICSCSEVMVIPIVIGALGTVSKNYNHWLVLTSVNPNFGTLQNVCLLERLGF